MTNVTRNSEGHPELEQRELAEKLTSLLSTYRHISDSYVIVINQQLLVLFQCLCIINMLLMTFIKNSSVSVTLTVNG